jgi:hypothetical protein
MRSAEDVALLAAVPVRSPQRQQGALWPSVASPGSFSPSTLTTRPVISPRDVHIGFLAAFASVAFASLDNLPFAQADLHNLAGFQVTVVSCIAWDRL